MFNLRIKKGFRGKFLRWIRIWYQKSCFRSWKRYKRWKRWISSQINNLKMSRSSAGPFSTGLFPTGSFSAGSFSTGPFSARSFCFKTLFYTPILNQRKTTPKPNTMKSNGRKSTWKQVWWNKVKNHVNQFSQTPVDVGSSKVFGSLKTWHIGWFSKNVIF